MKKELRNKKGITLIALIISIIVMLILVGVTIVSLTGEQGLIGRANTAQIQNLTAGYIEEINFEVTNEKIDRIGKEKSEAFIISIKNRVEGKSWVKQITVSDESLRTDIPDEDKNLLVVNTKEDFVIMVNVDNNKLSASIKGTSDKYETYTITYVANNGTEETSTQEGLKGLSVSAKENTYEKQYHSFAGWCENQNGEGTIYVKGSIIQLDSDKTLYAIWTRNTIVLSFDANTGTGSMEDVETGTNSNIAYPECSGIIKTGYNFVGWNTEADGSGTNYAESQKSTVEIEIGEQDITLYAQWEAIIYDITYALDGGTATNPATYTADTNTFELVKPTKDGYVFMGWTGTGLDSATKEVIIENGSFGDRAYTATWHTPFVSYALGQEVTIGEEQFFVIEASGIDKDKVKLIAKYNLNKNGTAQQNAAYTETNVAFSTSKYWTGNQDDLNSISSQSATAVNKAKTYGESKGGEGRLLKISEYNSLKSSIGSILYGRGYNASSGFLIYWLASSNNSYVYSVWGNGSCTDLKGCGVTSWMGVRPVLTISKDLIL